MSTITGTYHNAFQHCRGTLIITCFSLWVWVISDCISNQLNWSSTLLPAHPLKSRQQRHWAPDTQSTLCAVQFGHYALQPALEHPAEPFTSQICCSTAQRCTASAIPASRGRLKKSSLVLQEQHSLQTDRRTKRVPQHLTIYLLSQPLKGQESQFHGSSYGSGNPKY